MSDTEVKQRVPRSGSAGRQTQPAGWHPYQRGGIGVIPRRSITDPAALSSRSSLSHFAENNPLRLLSYLPAIDPDVALAHDTDVTLICDPECVQIVAVDNPEDDTPNTEDTALIAAMWDAQPPEVGGLYGFMEQMVALFNFTGLACGEAVAGRRGEGVYRAWPVDSLTIGFGRDDVNADQTAYQRQTGAANGWKRLNPETFFWDTVGKWPDSGYGCPRYAPALAEVLVNIAFWKSITDAVQNAAWPRLAFGLPYKELKELYMGILGFSDAKADEAVAQDIEAFKKEVASILPDDNAFFDSTGKMMLIPGGTFEGIEQIITERRSRIVRALKQLPLFLGLNDSTTETQATQQVRIHGKRLGSLRSRVVAIALKISTLHLRLMGRPTVAKAVYQPIFPGDALQDAQTESIRIANADEKERLGYVNHDDAAMEITGSKAVAEKQPQPGTETDRTEPDTKEETRQERQARERQSARAELREQMRAEYRANVQRRMQVERGELVEV